jgi:group II intron reverse transcriptase/maturase
MVQKLQNSLQAKAKAEPTFRFYSLWDKICRVDVLQEAYCRCERNAGAAGVDGETFEAIESRGLGTWLEELREELCSGAYRPQALLRVWIPKSNGGKRPLSIPTIRDRVVESATLLVLNPIFEEDLLPNQYGFRSNTGAKKAILSVFWHVNKHGRREIIDADLSDYFSTIPHGKLMRCIARRIADRKVLSVIKAWLTAPVAERTRQGFKRTTEARNTKRGTAQGSPISPLMANLYFRRFLLAWEQQGCRERYSAFVVNYADDFVICCERGNGEAAMQAMRYLMTKLGLTVNEAKTRLLTIPEATFSFLGYEFGRFYGKGGMPYIGTRPSRKAIKRALKEIHAMTSKRWNSTSPEERIDKLNSFLRGWAGYFDQGPVTKAYHLVRSYTERRIRRWLIRRSGQRGTGYRQYPNEYLYGELGLYKLPQRRFDLSRAKA